MQYYNILPIYDRLRILDVIKFLTSEKDTVCSVERELDLLFNADVKFDQPIFITIAGICWQLDVTTNSLWQRVLFNQNKYKWKLTKTKL